MYEFTRTSLKNTFKQASDADNFYLFLDDFTKSYYDGDTSRSILLDRVAFDSINEFLFKRDNNHYYYLYKDVFCITKEQFIKDGGPNNTKNKNFVFCMNKDSVIIENVNFKTEKQVRLNTKRNSYFSFFSKEKTVTFDIVKRDLNKAEEISMAYFGMTYMFGNHRNDLKNIEVRKMISVIFWKYLCIQQDVPFH